MQKIPTRTEPSPNWVVGSPGIHSIPGNIFHKRLERVLRLHLTSGDSEDGVPHKPFKILKWGGPLVPHIAHNLVNKLWVKMGNSICIISLIEWMFCGSLSCARISVLEELMAISSEPDVEVVEGRSERKPGRGTSTPAFRRHLGCKIWE